MQRNAGFSSNARLTEMQSKKKKKEWYTPMESGKRSFYKTEVNIIILTEGSYDPISLDQLAHDATHGECSMVFTVEKSEQIDGPTMARLCLEQYSDPALFNLTDEGEDLDDVWEGEEKKQGEDEQSLPPEYRITRMSKPQIKAPDE
jgi:hypothetical protein